MRIGQELASSASEDAGVVLDLAAGYFLNLLNHFPVGDHAVDRVLDGFKDQGLLLFVHGLLPGVCGLGKPLGSTYLLPNDAW
jgi:hypothetical protein